MLLFLRDSGKNRLSWGEGGAGYKQVGLNFSCGKSAGEQKH